MSERLKPREMTFVPVVWHVIDSNSRRRFVVELVDGKYTIKGNQRKFGSIRELRAYCSEMIRTRANEN